MIHDTSSTRRGRLIVVVSSCRVPCCRLDADASQPSSSRSLAAAAASTDVNCRQSSSGHVTQSPLIGAWQARSSVGGGESTLAGAVLRGVDLSLAAVVLGASQHGSAQRQPQTRIHVTTDESTDRATTTASPSHAARPASAIGRRSVGVPHGSLRAFQQQQQQQQQRRAGQRHNTLLVVPSSRSASSSPSVTQVSTRGGSVSTSPSSASPSPSPEPISRAATSRSLSTQRPLGVTRPSVAADDKSTSRSCVPRQLTAGEPSRADELHEQETFV